MAGDQGERARQHQSWVRVEVGTEAQPELVRWSTYYPPGGSPGGQSGTVYAAYALRGGGRTVLIDPVQAAPNAEARLATCLASLGSQPVASVLTNDMHERDAYALRERFGAQVWAPAAGQGEYDGQPDRFYEDGDALPGGLRAIKIDGPFPGDTFLLWQAPSGRRVLFTGDAILGAGDPQDPRPDRPRPAPGLYLHWVNAHPRGVQDESRFKSSLRRLLDEAFDLVCPAHGIPFGDGAKNALARLVI
jgi:glyoxylase-like metal-dependent hydrolase (beta-lactamase superfamily II)